MLKYLIKIRKELERIFKIVAVKLENNKLKQQVLKLQLDQKKDQRMIDFYCNNYDKKRDECLQLTRDLKHEKELHQISIKNLQQAHSLINRSNS